jgi:transposase
LRILPSDCQSTLSGRFRRSRTDVHRQTFLPQGKGNKRITAELQTAVQSSGISNSTMQRWITKFKTGDLSCDDDPRPRRPIEIFGPVLRKFLERDPFLSTKVISRHFRISPLALKEVLGRELGLKKFSTRSRRD